MKNDWPESYKKWTGGFSDLIATANKIVSEMGYDADITERTARHYQHKNLVSKGERQGKSSVFFFDDLASLVATKTMVKEGWTLQNTASLLNAPTQSSLTATDVVRQLMSRSEKSPDVISGPLTAAPAIYQSVFAPSSLPSHHHYLFPGIVLQVDSKLHSRLTLQQKEDLEKFLQKSASTLSTILKEIP